MQWLPSTAASLCCTLQAVSNNYRSQTSEPVSIRTATHLATQHSNAATNAAVYYTHTGLWPYTSNSINSTAKRCIHAKELPNVQHSRLEAEPETTHDKQGWGCPLAAAEMHNACKSAGYTHRIVVHVMFSIVMHEPTIKPSMLPTTLDISAQS
jgi:hypothetical protein